MKIFRKLRHDWKWFVINLIGLSTSIACIFIVYLFIRQQLSYDRFHQKADRIYRITLDSNRGAASMHPARVTSEVPKQLISEYPAIENMVRLVPFRNAIVKIDEKRFYNRNVFATDTSFFGVFDFKIISGNPQKTFSQPLRAMISRSLANKYFGSTDVTGKEISIIHQQEPSAKVYTIDGVMEDFPANSHFHADLLTSFSSDNDQTTWAYTYFLLKKGTDAESLRKTIQQKWETENKTGEPVPFIFLQKLTDIHLFSQKSREIEKNGDIRSVILLVTSIIIILFIALINYLNLSRVQFISRLKYFKVKLINGASKSMLAKELIAESLILSFASILIGLLIAIKLSNILNITVFQSGRIADICLISLFFMIVITSISIFPLFISRIVTDIKLLESPGKLYKMPLVLQYSLAIIAITGSIVLNRQMNFISSLHPASQNANMIVIADNTWEAVQRYELLKGELLKNPDILDITAAMEKPGGEIIDNMAFEMEGIEKKEEQRINIFTTDSNFFTFLGIKPVAGSTESRFTPSHQWETDAIELSTLRQNENIDKDKLADLEKRVGNYHEKYILNLSALKMLGIASPEEAVGKRFRINFFLPDLFPEGEIAAVVPDFHYTDLHTEEKPLAIVSRKLFNYCFIIRINPLQRKKAISGIAATWDKINPEFPFQYEYITDVYQEVYAGEYTQTRVLSLFAIISVILSSLGIFALAAFSMERRIKEIGIRKVNGAKVSEILVMLNMDFLKWVVIAFIIATPVVYYVMLKWLQNFAYKTNLSWWIFALSGALALGVALITVSWQSWRAATRNPVESLRYE